MTARPRPRPGRHKGARASHEKRIPADLVTASLQGSTGGKGNAASERPIRKESGQKGTQNILSTTTEAR
eukprot:CAMPEP_0171106952 /NCGR_PEP_ID=MMETSP0766_2-20121228/65862_1 /TAXON_ID=439317 /ORGANISM="Gambierdiscus australes, Strain CAWD 149" /LENGTH=68 /DNA_ID=CAMNT_0011568169 /DNA_START=5 /DNA_END=209 /DNA_ORIENTATION=+